MRQGRLSDIHKQRLLFQGQMCLEIGGRFRHGRIVLDPYAIRNILEIGRLATPFLGTQTKIRHVSGSNESFNLSIFGQDGQAFDAQFGHECTRHANGFFGSSKNDLTNGCHVIANGIFHECIGFVSLFETGRHDA